MSESLAGLHGVQGVEGSNPTVPTIIINKGRHLAVFCLCCFRAYRKQIEYKSKTLNPVSRDSNPRTHQDSNGQPSNCAGLRYSGWTGSDAEGLRAVPILPQGELYG